MCVVVCLGSGQAAAQPGVEAGEPEPEAPTWETMGVGPALLVIPPRPELGRAGIRDVGAGTLSYRKVRMLSPNVGWESVVGLVVHDEEVLVDLWDWYTEGDRRAVTEKWTLLGLGWLFFPLVAGSSQAGVGAFVSSAPAPPFVHVSGGIMFTPMLWRLNQPGMRFDIGSGLYGGAGFMLTRSVGFSARVSYDALLLHQLSGRGYGHVWTAVATLDFKPPDRRKRTRKADQK